WHLHGKGVSRDYKRAVSLLKEAASKKNPDADYDLAVCYELGKGVKKNQKAALLWYRRAARDGDPEAPTEVARCYYYGIGTNRNLKKAIAWYRKDVPLPGQGVLGRTTGPGSRR